MLSLAALTAAAALSIPAAASAKALGTGLVTGPERPWTLMVYGAADNNADGPILEFLDEVRRAFDDDPGMEIVLFIDRSEGFSDDAQLLGADFAGARIYRLGRDTAELLDATEFFPGMASPEDPDADLELDSADPLHLASFVAFGKKHYPAQRYALMIYSHADGCGMCPDEASGSEMSIPQLTDYAGEEASVDFLALELCNMGGIEIAYQWRPGNGGFSADVLMAIPTAGPPLDWHRAFARIRSEGHGTSAKGEVFDPATMTAQEFGTLVVEEGHAGRKAMLVRHPELAERLAHETAACYDLKKVEKAKEAVDALAVALATHGSKEVFEELRGPGEKGVVMNYVRDQFGRRPFVDLTDLVRRAEACDELPPEVRAAATRARVAVDATVLASFGMEGYEDFVPGENGIFIAFPAGDATLDGPLGPIPVWRELGWYTPLEADQPGAPYGRWAFLADGATPDNGEVENWFELLDCWYDDTTSDPGGFNRYVW